MRWMRPWRPDLRWRWCIRRREIWVAADSCSIRMADGKTHFLDYREKAPAAATANMYLDAKGNVIEDASAIGYKAIGVPGSVAGMVYAEKKYGKLSLEQVMAPAIKLARGRICPDLGRRRGLADDKHLAKFPESRRIFQRDGNYYKAGEIFKQPELARTLERIAENPDDFYHGHWRANWLPPCRRVAA